MLLLNYPKEGSRDIIKYEGNSCNLIWTGKERAFNENQCADFQEVQQVFARPLFSEESIFSTEEFNSDQILKNHYYFGDNLDVLQFISKNDDKDKIKLIYIDPPYMSQINYHSVIEDWDDKQQSIHAFEDRWGRDMDHYLNMLYPRLQLMHQVLHSNGSIFVHVDWHVSHYVRILLDEIFGRENFINEIIWCYSGGGNARRNLQRKHDTIFWYARSQAYTFNPQYRPYTQGTLERGLTAIKGDRYQLSEKGAVMQDWWTDINKILSPTAYENVKYPTQKPKKLLERIINMASDPGDLVADFFGGSGTVAEVCNELNRSWILCDNSSLALQTSISRLIKSNGPSFSIHAAERNAGQIASQADSMVFTSPEGAVLKLKRPVLQDNGHGKYWLSLGIDYYQPADLPDHWDAGKFASYIDFWEIDSDYDELIFKSQYQLLRNKNKSKNPVPLNILISVPKEIRYNIAIKLYDIFARQIYAKLSFETD